MPRLSFLAVAAALLASGCDRSSAPTTPSGPQNRFVFTATLLPSNERPNPVTNAEASGSGSVTITMNTTRDANGVITAATMDFSATFNGFPPGTALTAAHIHSGDANTAGTVVVNLALSPGEVAFPNGSGSLAKNGVAVNPVDLANQILNNPAGFYFNVHTALNPGGVARGQLVRTQ